VSARTENRLTPIRGESMPPGASGHEWASLGTTGWPGLDRWEDPDSRSGVSLLTSLQPRPPSFWQFEETLSVVRAADELEHVADHVVGQTAQFFEDDRRGVRLCERSAWCCRVSFTPSTPTGA
jgi:hypothetical protein